METMRALQQVSERLTRGRRDRGALVALQAFAARLGDGCSASVEGTFTSYAIGHFVH